MMNLETTYLNMRLRSPLVVSASPLSRSIENIKRMESAGAGAVILFSLFEEQLRNERRRHEFLEAHPKATEANAAALYPDQQHFHLSVDEYLAHIRKAKEAVGIPIIASLNAQSLGSWIDCAQKIEAAGADALELNISFLPTDDIDRTADQIENHHLQILKVAKESVKIPVAVKLTPFFTNLSNMARRLDQSGANALVLFNRFYQPDFEPQTLKPRLEVSLGSAQDLRLVLQWIALLYGKVRADLAATGGIYSAEDVIKLLMVGAKVTLLTSVLLKKGIDYLVELDKDLRRWLDENDYASVAELQGMVSQSHHNNPAASERAQYIQILTSYRTQWEADA